MQLMGRRKRDESKPLIERRFNIREEEKERRRAFNGLAARDEQSEQLRRVPTLAAVQGGGQQTVPITSAGRENVADR